MNTDTLDEHNAQRVPAAGNLTRLSDNELLASTRDLVGASNRLLAALLAHLAEVEARGIHRSRACSSLYTYCIYELRLSEDAASRRVCAARLVQQFPVLLGAIAGGELHLTGLLMLGPHLTRHNHLEVLARAKHRTKKELAQLVRVLDPLPDVPPRIEPLGPEPTRALNPFANPSWQNFVGSMCPIRDLAPGERPRDWGNAAFVGPEAVSQAHPSQPSELLGSAPARRSSSDAADAADAADAELVDAAQEHEWALVSLTGPQRYKVQFTASEEYVQLVERAKELLSHTLPGGSLAEVHFRAMQALVTELERRKYAVTQRPRVQVPKEPHSEAELRHRDKARDRYEHDERNSEADKPLQCRQRDSRLQTDGPRQRDSRSQTDSLQTDSLQTDSLQTDSLQTDSLQTDSLQTDSLQTDSLQTDGQRQRDGRLQTDGPRQREADSQREPARRRGRYVAAAERRAVFQRDAGRCSYADASGQRCRETRRLELHHLKPFATGGDHCASNLALRCRAHNALAAEEDFGIRLIERKRKQRRHEPFASKA